MISKLYKPLSKILGILSLFIYEWYHLDYKTVMTNITQCLKRPPIEVTPTGDQTKSLVDISVGVSNTITTSTEMLALVLGGFLFLAIIWIGYKMLMELSESIDELLTVLRDMSTKHVTGYVPYYQAPTMPVNQPPVMPVNQMPVNQPPINQQYSKTV